MAGQYASVAFVVPDHYEIRSYVMTMGVNLGNACWYNTLYEATRI